MRDATFPLTLPSPPVGERDQDSPSKTEDQRSWPVPLTLPSPPVGERDQNSPSKTEDQRSWPILNPSPPSRVRGPRFEPRRCRRVGDEESGEARAESGEGVVFPILSSRGRRGTPR